VRRVWDWLCDLLRRRYTAVLVVAVLVALALGVGGTLLKFETSQDALIGGGSQVAKDNHRYQDNFGGEPMLTVYQGKNIEDLFTPTNIARMQALDDDLHKTGLYRYVLSPLTAMKFAQAELGVGPAIFQSAAKNDPANAQKYNDILNGEIARVAAVKGPQTLTNPEFVRVLLYDANGDIRPALKTNFIDKQHALMITRLHGNDPIGQMGKAADTVKRLVAKHQLEGFTSLSTGPAVLLQDINDYLQHGIVTLGGLAVLVMIIVLFVVFRVRSRLLSLGCVVISTLCTFGIMGYVGLPLNLVTISGLPILIGMGVDFAIQMHSRFEEEIEYDHDPNAAVGRVMVDLAPALSIAMIAAVLGFVAMQISKVPMIRQFGAMLDLGVALIFLVVLFVPLAYLLRREHRRPTPPSEGPPGRELLERVVRSLALAARNLVVPMILVGLVLVIGGFAVEGRFTIQTDPEKWIPPNGSTEKSLKELRAQAGFSTELDFMVEANNVMATPVASWMDGYARQQLQKHPSEIVEYSSLGGVISSVTQGAPNEEQMRLLYGVAPPDVQTAFVSKDFSKANLLFPIANISLSQRGKLLDEMKADVHAPAGVKATPSGLVVVGIALVDALEANRTTMTFVALGLVALWLLLFYRKIVETLLTLVPVMIAVGLSSLVVFATGLELSPLTSVAGPLVIAVGTEFAVLILTRYVEERERGRSREDAIDVGTVRIGRAFVASGLTLVGGFAVIASSQFPLLRDFGIIVALNTLVALLVALIVLPPLLVWADRHPRIGGFSPGFRPGAEHEVTLEERDMSGLPGN
jgi:hydrophobe/amphiphile efflux-3 (HAE3) family protein